MFDQLTQKLQKVFKNLRGEGRLTAEHIEEALKEIRMALLEADVNFKVVKQFVESVRAKALGQDVLSSLTPGAAGDQGGPGRTVGDARWRIRSAELPAQTSECLSDRWPARIRKNNFDRQAGTLAEPQWTSCLSALYRHLSACGARAVGDPWQGSRRARVSWELEPRIR